MKKPKHYWLVVEKANGTVRYQEYTKALALKRWRDYPSQKKTREVVKVIRADCVQAEAKRQQLAVLKRGIARLKARRKPHDP